MSASSPYDTYTSPLAERNASPEMLRIWSPRHKFQTWRKIWLAVAEAQHELGLPVTKEQVEELRANLEVTDEDMERAKEHERRLRHDVMAHVHAWGDRCPRAKGIIHLGMTSEDVGSNADIILVRQSMDLVLTKIARVVLALGEFAHEWTHTPALGFTHYQPAQPTTVGRRAANWASDLDLCRGRIGNSASLIHPRGFRGATGTQASFRELFGGRSSSIDEFETRVLMRLDPWDISDDERLARTTYSSFARNLTGQTYPRVIDTFVLADLASTASVLHKIATDIRLLSNRKELDEPFGEKQIGSSAMPYKRNPMRCERICGLSRFVMNLVGNAYDTAATQWLERTLDDSSNRRLSLPEAFLALDGALDLMHNVAGGLEVHEATVRANLMAELPFMASENILMAAVKAGGDRQELHEVIRRHAQEAGLRVKKEGKPNDLIDRLKADPHFAKVNFDEVLDPMAYVGRSVEQVDRFLKEVVEPLREQYGEALKGLAATEPRV